MKHFCRHCLLYGIIFILSGLLFLKTQTYTVSLRSLLVDAGLAITAVVALVGVVNWLLGKIVENNNARVDALELPSELLLEKVDTHSTLLIAIGFAGSAVSAYCLSQADVYHQYFTWPFVLLVCLLLAAIGSYESLRAARRLTLSAKRQVWLDVGEYAFYFLNLALLTALPVTAYCIWNPESDTALFVAEIAFFCGILSYLPLLGVGLYNSSHFWWRWFKTNRSYKCFLDHQSINS